MQCQACWEGVACLKKLLDNDAKLRDAYKRKFNDNKSLRGHFIAYCHGFTGEKMSSLIMADGPEKNSIRSGSVKRQIDFLDLRDLKARLANDNELLQSTIADGPAFADQDTGDDMYPVLKQEDTPSYIYRLPSREVSPVPPCHSPSEV